MARVAPRCRRMQWAAAAAVEAAAAAVVVELPGCTPLPTEVAAPSPLLAAVERAAVERAAVERAAAGQAEAGQAEAGREVVERALLGREQTVWQVVVGLTEPWRVRPSPPLAWLLLPLLAAVAVAAKVAERMVLRASWPWRVGL